jgi:hypothetical protein
MLYYSQATTTNDSDKLRLSIWLVAGGRWRGIWNHLA